MKNNLILHDKNIIFLMIRITMGKCLLKKVRDLDWTYTKTLARAQSKSAKYKQGFELACMKFFSNSGNFLFGVGRTKF